MNDRIALVQANFEYGNIAANLAYMNNLVRMNKAQNPGLRLVLFPEMSATGYFLSPSLLRQCAEVPDGPIGQRMSETAREYGLYIGYGYAELGIGGEIYNSFALVDPHGERIAHYRKIHLTPTERVVFTPGSEIVSVKTEWAHIGFMICWDLAFPEFARALAIRGVDLILAPSAWEKPFGDPFVHFARARALDNTVFVAVCNHVGPTEDLVMCGRSGMYGPDGALTVSAGDDEENLLVAEIDWVRRQSELSGFYSMMQERRIDLYGLKGEGVTGV